MSANDGLQRGACMAALVSGMAWLASASAAEGFYRVGHSNGRWDILDPQGRVTFLRGVDHVRYRGVYTYVHGAPFGHYERWNDAHYANVAEWSAETSDRLRTWGFNMLGGGEGEEMRGRGFAYAKSLALSHGLTVGTGNNATGAGKEGLWICPHEGSPCTEFPNVFHPGFPAYCDGVAAEKCAPLRDDRDLVGYFIDNELAWWGRGPRATGLFDSARALPPSHTARQAVESFLRERGIPSEEATVPVSVKREFLRMAAEKYFTATVAAIRRHDPNHMVLGTRFAGVEVNDPIVWEVAGRHCDMLTVNCYPWADLDRNVILTRQAGGERIADVFRRLCSLTGRPLFVTEWSFPALDTPCPSTHGGGMRCRTQRERARASELFARTLLAMPEIVGYSYFMWVDEPPEGISTVYPEDSNYGLVNERGEPYGDLTRMFAQLHRNVKKLRCAPLPKERPGGVLASRFASLHGLKPANGFAVTGNDWRWTNDAGLTLEGGTGAGRMVRRTTLKGADLGTVGAMGQYTLDGASVWHELETVSDVRFADGALELTASRRGWKGVSFEMTFRLTLDASRPEFMLELLRVRNRGSAPIRFKAFFLCQYSPFAREGVLRRKRPPTWGDDIATGWQARDGRVFSAMTRAPDVAAFNYYVDPQSVHPDAAFAPSDLPAELSPGAEYECAGRVWLLCRGGR
ncbi:MAG: hypothetical protein SPG40_10065 [Kiritimatiellia bacterium]|nr:hypothetical protein [Kiritimatiellia bacterium]